MVLRKSYLRRRAEGGPGSRVGDERRGTRDRALLGALKDLFRLGARERPPGELDELPLPDLLSAAPAAGPPLDAIVNLLELAFLGRASAGELDRELDAMPAGGSSWVRAHFAEDLFLAELVRTALPVRVRGQDYTPHRGFLEAVLAGPPPDLESVRFRQAILRELESDPAAAAAVERLLGRVSHLLTLLRASRDDARLEPTRFRFDVLRALRSAVECMDADFAGAASGLRRLHEAGARIRASAAWGRMTALLDHDQGMASLTLEAVVGADGRLRHLEIRSLRERRANPFFRRPLRRWLDRLRIVYHRYNLHGGELVELMVMGVFQEIVPAMARVIQLLCHLEVYAASRGMAATARNRGLEVSLPELAPGAALEIRALFNPLLLALEKRPVPTDLVMEAASPIVLVTGPNSGGKTRLLQAVGIAQVLSQSGLYAPCAGARMPFAAGLFASIVELDRADQSEGRLGTEMLRLRTLFETVPPGSLVLLDELCSGTNPSEAIEIIDTVLRLLRQIDPIALVTTHFLDFAAQLERQPTVAHLGFLQAEIDGDRGATFRFVSGVATTSLAVGTARRLGVTFEELERHLEGRAAAGLPDASPQVGELAGADREE